MSKNIVDVDWQSAAMRALLIKQMSEKDIVELHELENTRAFRYFGEYQNYKDHPDAYPNWLIVPYNIMTMWFNKVRGCGGLSKEDLSLIIDIISKKMPEDVEQWGGYSTSVEWQHAWDWTILHDIPVLALPKREKKGGLADYMEERVDRAHRENQ